MLNIRNMTAQAVASYLRDEITSQTVGTIADAVSKVIPGFGNVNKPNRFYSQKEAEVIRYLMNRKVDKVDYDIAANEVPSIFYESTIIKFGG